MSLPRTSGPGPPFRQGFTVANKLAVSSNVSNVVAAVRYKRQKLIAVEPVGFGAARTSFQMRAYQRVSDLSVLCTRPQYRLGGTSTRIRKAHRVVTECDGRLREGQVGGTHQTDGPTTEASLDTGRQRVSSLARSA